jgi:hypothetical protein
MKIYYCKDCYKKLNGHIAKRCRKCYIQYKNKINKKSCITLQIYLCKDCKINKITYFTAIKGEGRCRKCASIIRGKKYSGRNHKSWKGGIKRLPLCEICGKRLSKIQCKRCKQCMNFGRKLTKQTKEKIRKSVLNNPRKSKIEINKLLKSVDFLCHSIYKKFRNYIRMKYKNTCQICNRKNGRNIVHHLKERRNFPELCMKESNVILLCINCHTTIHNITDKGIRIITELRKQIKEKK